MGASTNAVTRPAHGDHTAGSFIAQGFSCSKNIAAVQGIMIKKMFLHSRGTSNGSSSSHTTADALRSSLKN